MKKIDFEEKELQDLEGDSIYREQAREMLVEDDEMSPEEEGFMMGWERAG